MVRPDRAVDLSGARRTLNDRLLQTERQLTHPAGLPGRKWFKHLVYAQGLYLGYGADVFPGLAESVRQRDWGLAPAQLHILSNAVRNAARVLAGQ